MKSKKLVDIEKRIEALQKQKAAEMARIRTQAKKDDTRRKILVGACILEEAESQGTMPELLKKMDRFLTRPNDRVLFGLSEKQGPDVPEG